MELLVAALGATALWAYYKHLKSQSETPDPPPGSSPPPLEGKWSNVPPGYYLQILARRFYLVTWHNTLFQREASNIQPGMLTWHKEETPGSLKLVYMKSTITDSNLSVRVWRSERGVISDERNYSFSAAEIAKAVRDQDSRWFNGSVLFDVTYIAIIIRLAKI